MNRTFAASALAFFALAGCSTAAVESDPGAVAPAPPGAAAPIVPTGTTLTAELDETLSTKSNKVGDRFTATVKEDVSVSGSLIVPQGSKISGLITGIDPTDRIGDQAAMRIAFESITVNGRVHAFSADVSEVDVSLQNRAGVGDVQEKAGVGAAAGAVIGAVIGGSLKDILVGGVLGAGAGTIVSLGLGDVEAALPQGTDLKLVARRPIS